MQKHWDTSHQLLEHWPFPHVEPPISLSTAPWLVSTSKMYLLDAAGKKEVAQKVDSFTVTPKVGSEEEGFTLVAEKADEQGLSAVYMLDDQQLSIAIPLGVDIEIKIGDKVYKGEIKAHEPLDH